MTITKSNMIRLFFLVLLAIYPLIMSQSTVAAPTPSTRIVYPPDKIIVQNDTLLVIGLGNGHTGKMSLTIHNAKGNDTREIELKHGAFSESVILQPGMNNFVLSLNPKHTVHVFRATSNNKTPTDFMTYYLHGNLNISRSCQECHPTRPGQHGQINYTNTEQNFTCLNSKCHQDKGKKKYKHGPFKQKKCTDCHNPHGSFNKFFTLKPRAALCFICHTADKDMATSGKFVHFPITQGECTSCHAPHESNIEFHLKRDSMIELCAGCHGKSMLEYEYMHEPTAAGDCNACHTPHISNFKGLLYKNDKDLCITCHGIREEEFKSRYVHEPVQEGCSICHDPHGSTAKYHIHTKKDKAGHYIKSSQPIKDLCLSCHTELNPYIAKAIKSSKVQHPPVTKGNCVICHTPHSTNFPNQLKAPPQTLCFTCHKKIAEKINNSVFKHGPVNKGDCAQCHLVHGSNNINLLRDRFSGDFSGKFNIDNFKLCFNCHNQNIVLDKDSQDTGFRNGRTNLHYVHVKRQKKSIYCKSCHDIHASNQERHIRKSFPSKDNITITMKFKKTSSGGGCIVGCHKPREYDRQTPLKYTK